MIAWREYPKYLGITVAFVATCISLIISNSGAKADVIFSLNDVLFDDSATATGTFTINQYGYLSS